MPLCVACDTLYVFLQGSIGVRGPQGPRGPAGPRVSDIDLQMILWFYHISHRTKHVVDKPLIWLSSYDLKAGSHHHVNKSHYKSVNLSLFQGASGMQISADLVNLWLYYDNEYLSVCFLYVVRTIFWLLCCCLVSQLLSTWDLGAPWTSWHEGEKCRLSLNLR